ncbi:MAG: cytochrome c oxidase assembly protein [Actinomycetota bacterium]
MASVSFSLDPGVLVTLLAGIGLYARAITILARRGWQISRWQQASWYAGIGLMAAGLLSPIDTYSDQLLTAHMAQHLLIADLAAPLLIVGMRTPVLVFILPRAVLVPLAHQHWLRAIFSFLRRPLVALPLFVITLYFWHLQFAFVGALRNPYVHAAQHISFVGASMLVWWAALEPGKARMPGHLWKIGHLGAARMASMFLGVAFVFMRAPAYSAFYGDSASKYGLTPLTDQQIAGGMMMTLDVIVVMFVLTLFFWRAASDSDRQEGGTALPATPTVSLTNQADASTQPARRPT